VKGRKGVYCLMEDKKTGGCPRGDENPAAEAGRDGIAMRQSPTPWTAQTGLGALPTPHHCSLSPGAPAWRPGHRESDIAAIVNTTQPGCRCLEGGNQALRVIAEPHRRWPGPRFAA
jgi:hypothetical protein